MSLRTTIVLLLAVFGGYSMTAQQPPEQGRGFEAGSVHQFNGFDSVNLFNGNLNLVLPLASYSVASDVSYSFTFRYTGNVWNANEHCTDEHNGEPPVCGTRYFPQRDNAGMGWGIEFQELVTGVPSTMFPGTAPTLWRFKSSDSGEHFFFETLHEPKCAGSVTTNCDPVVAGVQYTRDGTYIRMKDGVGGAKVLEFPNGERRRFVKPTSTSPWTLQYIYGTSSTLDSNGIPQTNWVKYEYPNSATHSGVVDWQITDSHGREHRIYFQPGVGSGTDIVDKIRLAAFKRSDDSTSGDAYSELNLTYDDYTMSGTQPVDGAPSVVAKPCQALATNTATVRFLTRIDLPSGETWGFNYHKPSTGCDDSSATLIQATMPTLGKLNWTYQSYGFSSDTADQATGVLERRQSDALGNQTEYTKYVVGTGPSSGPPYTTTVESYAKVDSSWKLDSKVVNYFDRVSGPLLSLPFTTAISDSTKSTLKLSSETFDCNVTTDVCTSERRRYVTYEMDYVEVNASVNCNIDYPCARNRNRRMVAERTRYVTDGDRYADTDYSLFDGLGHYRKAVTGGTFSSGNVRTTETNYNSHSRGGGSVGVYALNANGTRAAGYTSLLSSDPWILGTYGNAYTLENGVRADVMACFDPTTGFLKRQRTLAGPTNEARVNDLLSVFTRDSGTGYASREEYFGGDKREVGEPNLPLGDLCTLTPPSHDKYTFRIDHTYQSGALKTSAYMRADGTQMPFLSLDNTIDSNTGFVASSTDAAGVVTSYRYDRSRRLDLVDNATGGLADTSYTYVNATASTPASVTATTGTGSARTSVKYEFDAFGRVWREHTLMPDESWSVTETLYDALGRKASVSEKETYTGSGFAPANKTVFSDYDAFGRVGTVRAPDQKTTTYVHTGDRLTTRTRDVATSVGGVTPSVTIEERDRAGRLAKVTENTNDVTTYEYDGKDHLTKVTMGSQPSRLFTYDGRGFAVSQLQPESGTTTYQYDSRGHVVKRIGEVATLTTEYDRAERVLSVSHDGVGLLKEFEYDRANAGVDYSMGKVAEAIRHNRSTALGDVVVQETYKYGTRLGLLSRKDTVISTVKNNVTTPGGEFSDLYEYTDLGAVKKVTYPACQTDCDGFTGPSRVIDATLTHGLVTNVAPYTTSITYHPNGLPFQVQHANVSMTNVGSTNGPLYTQTIADGMTRPDTISVTNFCTDTNLRINTHPVSGTSVSPNSPANLTVDAPGATQWQWYKVVGSSSLRISGQTTNTLTSPVAAESTYWVRVGNGNCSIDSNQAVVHVAACPTVELSVDDFSAIPQQGGSKTIHVTINGSAPPWTIQWSDLPQSSSTSLSSFDRVVTPGATTQYTLTILPSTGCSQSVSNPITVTVTPPAPTAVTATAVLTSRVTVSWSFSGQADQFSIERRGPGQSSFAPVGSVNSPATSFQDNSVAANTAYLYRVKAVKAGTSSVGSGFDLATTVIFNPDPIGFQTIVSAQPIMELRTAVNAVRALWSTAAGPFVFTDSSLSGLEVKAAHILELRSVLNGARSGLVLPAVQYTSPPPGPQLPFQAADINDLRGGVR